MQMLCLDALLYISHSMSVKNENSMDLNETNFALAIRSPHVKSKVEGVQ